MEQTDALRLALNMLEDTENPRFEEVAIGRAVSFRVVLSWIARLCDAYLGSEVLRPVRMYEQRRLVAQPRCCPHVSPARYPAGEKGWRRAGGDASSHIPELAKASCLGGSLSAIS